MNEMSHIIHLHIVVCFDNQACPLPFYYYTSTITLSLEGVLSLGESNGSLSSLFGLLRLFFLGQSSSQSSGLLGSQVLGQVLLTFVEASDGFSLVLVDDSQDSGNVLSHQRDLGQGSLLGLLDSQRGQLLLEFNKSGFQLVLRFGSKFVSLGLTG